MVFVRQRKYTICPLLAPLKCDGAIGLRMADVFDAGRIILGDLVGLLECAGK